MSKESNKQQRKNRFSHKIKSTIKKQQETRRDNDPSAVGIRWIANQIAKPLAKTNVTPNQVTFWKFVIFLPPILYLLIRGGYVDNLIAVLLMVLNSIFDLVDGSLARMKNMGSKLGGWMDGMLDVVFLDLVLLAVTLGVIKITGNPYWLIAGFLALVGQDVTNVMGSYFEREFGFDCYAGSKKFNHKFARVGKLSFLDSFARNIIVPSNFTYIFFFTFRYFLLLGVILYRLDIFIAAFAVMINIRWIAMCLVYGKYLQGGKSKLYTIKFLKEICLKKPE